jgi:NADPH2:quinone reductase
MRAVLCRSLDGPSALTIEDIPAPTPGPGEIAVAVAAVGLNFLDTLITRGRYQVKPELPFSPGAEIVGRVVAHGAGVAAPALGTRVVAYVGHGGAREMVIAKASAAIPVPDGVPDAIAAGLLVAYGTTMMALVDRAALKPGETLAVLGASGGAGSAAIEIGKLLGARVIAVSSGPKLEACRARGADEVVDYDTEDLKERLRALTAGRGVDVVYDAAGDRHTEPAVRALAYNGRLLVIGFAAGEIPRVPANLLLLRGCSMIGINWGAFVAAEPERHAANTRALFDAILSGRMVVKPPETHPLERAAEAIERLANRQVTGKVVLIV